MPRGGRKLIKPYRAPIPPREELKVDLGAANLARNGAELALTDAESKLADARAAAEELQSTSDNLDDLDGMRWVVSRMALPLNYLNRTVSDLKRKRDEAEQEVQNKRRATNAVAQKIFDHPDSVTERLGCSAGGLMALYSLWDPDTTEPHVFPMPCEDTPNLHASMLDELATYVRDEKMCLTMSPSHDLQGRFNAYRLSMLLSSPMCSHQIYVQHSTSLQHDGTPYTCSVADIFLRGYRVLTLARNSINTEIVPTTHEAFALMSPDNDYLPRAPEHPKPTGDRHQRFLLFLLQAFPYHCMTSGTLAVAMAVPLAMYVPRGAVTSPPHSRTLEVM
jgi:hypothetical protein